MHQTVHPKNRMHAEVPSSIDDLAVRKHSDQMRKRSGSVDSRIPLVSFLYTLIRDHVTPGQIEEIMLRQMPKVGETTEFSNGYLANYAQDVATRILPPTFPEVVRQALANASEDELATIRVAMRTLQQHIEAAGDAGVIALALIWAETLASEQLLHSGIIKKTSGDQA